MYGFICDNCGELTPLQNDNGEQVYFRLLPNEKLYCKKCSKTAKNLDNKKMLRTGATFVTIEEVDY